MSDENTYSHYLGMTWAEFAALTFEERRATVRRRRAEWEAEQEMIHGLIAKIRKALDETPEGSDK